MRSNQRLDQRVVAARLRAGTATPSGVMINFRPRRRCGIAAGSGADGQSVDLDAHALGHYSAASSRGVVARVRDCSPFAKLVPLLRTLQCPRIESYEPLPGDSMQSIFVRPPLPYRQRSHRNMSRPNVSHRKSLPFSQSRRFLYRSVSQVLRERIAAGIYEPGARVPGVADLAREFGVSTITVRRAVRISRSKAS
jgi:Bacterial regulatory proteins, gntR family